MGFVESIVLRVTFLAAILTWELSTPSSSINNGFDIDPEGYIMFCPCMGRFGNQISEFLGAMSFAKALNRTLVLPHFIEYTPYTAGSVQIPFDAYFRYRAVTVYHKAITMDFFMGTVGRQVYPDGKRTVLCYGPRYGQKEDTAKGCNAKEGNPFGPYWDHFGIDFDYSSFYGEKGLYYCGLDDTRMIKRWKEEYPADKFPVLAFTGTPASFPVKEEDVNNQRHILWSDTIWQKAEELVRTKLESPILAIHLRNGVDFTRACEHVNEGKEGNFFGSAACLGYENQKGFLSKEICAPSRKTIIKQLREAVKKHKINSIYISTDNDDMESSIKKNFPKLTVYSSGPHSDFKVDLCVMELANHWIGNCVSTFSSFVYRTRMLKKMDYGFWAFPEHAIPNPNAPKEIHFKTDITLGKDGGIMNEPVVTKVKEEL